MYAECCRYILMSASALCIHVGMSACFARPFVHQSVASVSCDCISLCSSFYLPSVHLSGYSVRPSVCMFTCTYVETNLVDIENWIDLTDTLSGLSLHWTLISFGCCLFVFRVAVQTTALLVCAPFYAKTVFTSAKKVHIYLWEITLYYSTSRLWQWRKVNLKPVITFENCKVCWYLKRCTKT